MRNIWIITKREYQAYFSSPIAYVVAAFILIVLGIIFGLTVYFIGQQPGSPPPGVDMVVGTLATVLVWTLPAVTMGLISDEVRLGTLELLLTSPIRDWEVIVGKWLAAFLFVLSIIALTLVYPIFMNQMIIPGIDTGVMWSGYLGVTLLAGELVAIGVLVSSLFKNQVASLVATLGIFIVLWFLVSPMASFLPGLGEVIRYIDIRTHFNSMIRGVIELKGIIYPVSLMAFFLMLGTVSLESRRWR